MRSTMLACFLVLLVRCGTAAADEPATSPQQEYDGLVKAQRDAQAAFSKAYQAAKTKEERDQASKEHPNSSPQRHSDGFGKLIEKYPNDPVALKALQWLMERDPGGTATTSAIHFLGDDLIKSPEMLDLCRILGWRPGRNSSRLLQTLIAENPHRDVQAHARYAQCMLMKNSLDRSRGDAAATALAHGNLEAELQDVIDKYGDVPYLRQTIKQAGEAELFELRYLSVGCVAPDIVGTDLTGQPLKLSEFRDKIVMLVFWGTWCGPCMAAVPEHQALLGKQADKPFAILGINSDQDREHASKVAAEKEMSWRSWWDGGSTHGPIASQWNVDGWPTIYLLDAQGTIRYKGEMLRAVSVRRNASGQMEQFSFLDDYVDQLVKELETRK